MTLWIIIGIVVIFIVFVISRIAPSANVKLADVPAVDSKTQSAGKDPSYAQLGFEAKDDAVNLQFSREDGRMGFDWSLATPSGERDKDKFIAFAESRGQHPAPREAPNGFRYVRVEDGDLISLMEAILREFYAVTPDTTMDLIYDGFIWP
jgi:hypothetical protein